MTIDDLARAIHGELTKDHRWFFTPYRTELALTIAQWGAERMALCDAAARAVVLALADEIETAMHKSADVRAEARNRLRSLIDEARYPDG